MGQLGPYLRTIEGGFAHYCPGCEEMHMFAVTVPLESGDQWKFNGDIYQPSFSPSMHITQNGRNEPEYQADEPTEICHYFLTEGELQFLNDSTHKFRGSRVPLPPLPEAFQDRK